jgi:hypothetical protein
VAFERDRLKVEISGIVLWGGGPSVEECAMEWFFIGKTSIGGSQISNWVLVLVAVVVIWVIYAFAVR